MDAQFRFSIRRALALVAVLAAWFACLSRVEVIKNADLPVILAWVFASLGLPAIAAHLIGGGAAVGIAAGFLALMAAAGTVL